MSVERLTLPRRSLRMSVNCGRFAASYDGAAGGGEQPFGVSQNVPHARGCYQSEDGNGGSFTAFGGSWHYAYWSRGVPGYHLQRILLKQLSVIVYATHCKDALGQGTVVALRFECEDAGRYGLACSVASISGPAQVCARRN
jgi:hypothetical protein